MVEIVKTQDPSPQTPDLKHQQQQTSGDLVCYEKKGARSLKAGQKFGGNVGDRCEFVAKGVRGGIWLEQCAGSGLGV